MRYIELYWDPSMEVFVNSDGFAYIGVARVLPYWALELARMYRDRGELEFTFHLNAWTIVHVIWPDEEVCENWYL